MTSVCARCRWRRRLHQQKAATGTLEIGPERTSWGARRLRPWAESTLKHVFRARKAPTMNRGSGGDFSTAHVGAHRPQQDTLKKKKPTLRDGKSLNTKERAQTHAHVSYTKSVTLNNKPCKMRWSQHAAHSLPSPGQRRRPRRERSARLGVRVLHLEHLDDLLHVQPVGLLRQETSVQGGDCFS